MMRTFQLAVVFGVALSVAQTEAAQILNPPGSGLSQIDVYEPIGNSFTAEDPAVFAALYLEPINSSFDSTDPIQFQLFEGVGTGGSLLFSQSFVVPGSFVGFFDVDLTSVPLVVGNDYSFVASIVGNSPYWGIRTSTGSAGSAIRNGDPGSGQFALRVTPTSVPEPSSLALLGIGTIGLIGYGWRRKQHTAA
jgi:hypothetical protein